MILSENIIAVKGIPPASKAAELFAERVIKKRCIICHMKICPSCKSYMVGSNPCHEECPYCEKSYHKHCWNKLIRSFGKCAFCLEIPPLELRPKDN